MDCSLVVMMTFFIGLVSFKVQQFQCRRSSPLKSAFGAPCIYAGHLKTDRTWYGYIANITIIGSGRVTFEFLYAVDRCCQNVLFYTDDQISIISSRLSCWQKEYLLRPEEDQVLRLTPSFSWSGCHDMQLDGVKTYVCKGGRSFTVGESSASEKPVTWYVAVSNCAALHGLDLRYQIEIYGQVGECHPKSTTDCPTRPSAAFALAVTSSSANHPTLHNAQLASNNNNLPTPSSSDATPIYVSPTSSLDDDSERTSFDDVPAPARGIDETDEICIMEGDVTTLHSWYGFMRNISLVAGGGFRYYFTYPYRMQTQNVILYREEDIVYLHWEQTCWQKEMIVNSMLVAEQVIDLSFRSSWSGCTTDNGGPRMDGNNLSCRHERRWPTPQRLYIALSNCRSGHGLLLHYRLEVFGLDRSSTTNNNLCSAAATANSYCSSCCRTTTKTRLLSSLLPLLLHWFTTSLLQIFVVVVVVVVLKYFSIR